VHLKKRKLFSFDLNNALNYSNAGVVVANSKVVGLASGSKPTTLSYNARAVRASNATSSLESFQTKLFSYTLEKHRGLLGTYIAVVEIQQS
jgi:hypothetical protein